MHSECESEKRLWYQVWTKLYGVENFFHSIWDCYTPFLNYFVGKKGNPFALPSGEKKWYILVRTRKRASSSIVETCPETIIKRFFFLFLLLMHACMHAVLTSGLFCGLPSTIPPHLVQLQRAEKKRDGIRHTRYEYVHSTEQPKWFVALFNCVIIWSPALIVRYRQMESAYASKWAKHAFCLLVYSYTAIVYMLITVLVLNTWIQLGPKSLILYMKFSAFEMSYYISKVFLFSFLSVCGRSKRPFFQVS